MKVMNYFLDDFGNRVLLTEEELREEDASLAAVIAMEERYRREALALYEKRCAFKARVLARDAAEREAKA